MHGIGDDEGGQEGSEAPAGELPVLTMMYDLAKWLLLRAEGFPRSLRFTLGDRIANTALDIQASLVAAAYAREKKSLLRAANLGLTQLRILVRLAKDVRAISIRQYEHASRQSLAVGAQVGGWLRSVA